MTPKEKAKELLDKFSVTETFFTIAGGKYPALIAVDEIYMNNTDPSKNDYWISVKQELEKL